MPRKYLKACPHLNKRSTVHLTGMSSRTAWTAGPGCEGRGVMGDDLVAFLRERLDEDERIADEEDRDYAGTSLLPTYDSEHQARWDTDRVRADVDAKRRILDLCGGGAEFPDFDGGYQSAWEDVLALLVLPFAGHPDYREEWKP